MTQRSLLNLGPTSQTPDWLDSVSPGQLAAALVEDALAPVVGDLATLNSVMPGFIPTESESARRVIDHVLGAGGKRIRPALFFMCCRMFGYRGPHYYEIASVSELVHTSSLLHDDVVDNSTLRRNKPTANSIYGDQTSVLTGDLIYSTASELMAATGNMEIVKTFARAIRLMSDGELLQLENVYNPRMREDVYFRILECKTAVLIEAACKAAALLAGATETERNALARFGHSVGMAFQLIDDALDYTGSADVVGKATLSDLAEGKVTLPVILLRSHATAEELACLESAFAEDPQQGRVVSQAAILEVARLVERYDTAELTVERAHRYTQAAMDALYTFPECEARNSLENLANKLLFRFN